MGTENTILQLFPAGKRAFWEYTSAHQKYVREIRLRADRPIVVYIDGKEVFLDREGRFTEHLQDAKGVSAKELAELLEHICHYSLYAFEDELRQGFLTVGGGHRVGVAGQAVTEDGKSLRTIKNISFLNIRISHEIKGAADGVLPRMYSAGNLKSALIISPPGCGKTTLLRDLVRQVSDGNAWGRGMTVGVVDERSEIAGSFCGKPQNDVGMRTDVLDACPKRTGMLLLLRAMSPRVIAIDELGSREEMEALCQTAACGCRILATAHGNTPADVERRFGISVRELKTMFQVVICLHRKSGKFLAEPVWGKEKTYVEGCGSRDDTDRVSGAGRMVSQPVYRQGEEPAGVTADFGSLGEQGAIRQGYAGGMLPAYAKAAQRSL